MVQFENVTSISGIDSSGQSFGSSWGDFNGDGLPDLWTSNHFSPVQLYLNQGDGTFVDVAADVLSNDGLDTHAAAWADFDNDGDQDLVQLTGARNGVGSEPTLVFVNEGGRLEERATELGLSYPLSRGRTPLWLDYDNDGQLDLLIASTPRPDGQAPSTIFRQADGAFVDVGLDIGFTPSSTNLAVAFLTDLTGDHQLDLVYRGSNPQLTIYDTTSPVFSNITNDVIAATLNRNNNDVIAGDFNNDLRPDLFLTRSAAGQASELSQVREDRLQALLTASSNQQGIQFSTISDLTFTLRSIQADQIFIGNQGFSPNSSAFTLSPDDPNVVGLPDYTPGVDQGLYIGYEPTLNRWQAFWSSPNTRDRIGAIIESNGVPLNEVTALGFVAERSLTPDQLLINTGTELVDQTQEAGLTDQPSSGKSAVTGDFDNDGDLDLYVVSQTVGNLPNILYDNQGDGTFVAIADAAGAAGSPLGLGQSVTTADYDVDGFLDLFVVNGAGASVFNLFTREGPYELFRNQGNNNHWLEIDLEGISTNRDGIGAQIIARSGDLVQLREQSGGIHFQAQNHSRIHFGLAQNTVVDELEIRWPNGTVQIIEDIPGDQVIRVVEPSGPVETGQPDYDIGGEEGVFLWQDEIDGTYHLRTVGGGEFTRFKVELLAADGLLEVTPIDLEGNDQLTITDVGFSFDSVIVDQQDGLDFRVAPGSEALISVTQDGVANPRQLFVGSQRSHLAPTGWILDTDAFSDRPSFTPGEDLGLFVGQGDSEDLLEFRWNGDGTFHRADLNVFGEADFTPIDLDAGGRGRDIFTEFNYGVGITGGVGTAADGLNVTVNSPGPIGFSYQQDGLFQSHRVNPLTNQLGLPNAYALPVASLDTEVDPDQPDYTIGAEEGVFLWKGVEEGTYRLRTVGGGELTNFEVEVISTEGVFEVTSVEVEGNDQLSMTDFGFEFNSVTIDQQDGIDFRVTPGSQTLISVTQDGVANPQNFYVGREREQLDLAGWILNAEDFPTRPAFTPGQDLGLFVGQGGGDDVLEFRWNGDGVFHEAELSVLSATGEANYRPVGLDGGGRGRDVLTSFTNGVNIVGGVGTGADGLNVTVGTEDSVGFTYIQDGLFQPNFINPLGDGLGLPNAYQLPI